MRRSRKKFRGFVGTKGVGKNKPTVSFSIVILEFWQLVPRIITL